jgi:mono/diheme cytochrome c family protein
MKSIMTFVRLIALATLIGACSSDGDASATGDAGTCPSNDLPASCPTPSPTYANDVQAIFATKCATCHGPGGEDATDPLDTYARVDKKHSECLDQIFSCRMPPAETLTLTSDERATLLAWFACDAPEK